jgi:uncharacterized protein
MRVLCGFLALSLTCCGFSPPTHYYTLTTVQNAQPLQAAGAPLQIFRVNIPAMLDRSAIVEQEKSGELKISGNNRWAAPLDGMIRAVLAGDMQQKLPGEVLLPGDPVPPADTRGLLINVRQFAAQDSARVVLLADWSLMSGHSAQPVLTRHEAIELPISSSSSSEVVPVMSQALDILSDRIAATIGANQGAERVNGAHQARTCGSDGANGTRREEQ